MFDSGFQANARRVLRVEVAGASLEAHACGALWWADQGVLIVSDLHLEKGSAYAAGGQMLPPYDTRATLNRVAALISALRPVTVISLGDSFHDRRARLRMSAEDVSHVRNLTSACNFIWVEGNHDPSPPQDLGGRCMGEVTIGPLTFRHEPVPGRVIGEIAGHLHPCARVSGRGRSVRARCFATDGKRLVMPAYGALAGGLNVRDVAFGPLFPQGLLAAVLGRDGVYAAAAERLLSDRADAR